MSSRKTEYFIVASHGWSASNWLAYSLNLHADIACSHSSAAILANDPDVYEGENLGDQIPDLRKGYLQRQNRPIGDVYADIKKTKDAAFIGSVHTYRLRDLPVQEERFESALTFRTFNLVRHPLDLVVSGFGQFKDLFRIDLNEFSWTLAKIVNQGLDIAEDVCRRNAVVPGDFETICFLGACVVLGSLKQDLDAMALIESSAEGRWGFRGTVRMEDVTQSPAAFKGLVAGLTGVPEFADETYLKNVFQVPRINIHNARGASGTIGRWQALMPWQQEAFRKFLEHFGIRSAYEGFGYDFQFLDR